MLVDLRSDADALATPGDVCIVGGGAAGVVLARRLAARGHDVILLESGGLDFEQATQDLYKGANVGMPYYDLEESRLRFFGGTVSIWGGRAARMDPIDFEKRDWVPHSGWPIRLSDVEPYYREADAVFELGEAFDEAETWQRLGVEPYAFDEDRIATALWRFDEAAERFAAARTRDLFDAPNVRVVLHANAVKLQAGADARTVEHVEVRPLDGPVRKVSAKHYVLACGAIENARLLLASDDVETAGIGNGRDQVGRFFMEHPTGRIAKVETAHPYQIWDAYQKRFVRSGVPLAPALRLGDAVQREKRALNDIATFKLQRDPKRGVALGNKLYHNLKHSISPDRKGRFLDHAYRGLRAWFHHRLRGTLERSMAATGMTGLYMIVRGEQAPNPDSRILLSAERDALGNRRADLDWQLCELDKHSARVMADTFGAELQRLGKGRTVQSEWLAEPGAQWPVDPTVGNHPIAGYHHVGGTRMSTDPAQGVVDADCRVHGYANLHVAGSSVFSTAGWANPTFTLVALALRLGDRLDTVLRNR
ncbi:MAG: GMC family oxidoreductase [Novosphingobium sp.]|nr:GMC family oxidoreductase [Novosphingobium sp.]